MKNIDMIAYIIYTILFVCFVMGPLFDSNYLLLLHNIMTPFVLFHWILKDNTCAVTLVERGIRIAKDGDKYNDDSCISCKIIEPIFDFPKNYPKHYKLVILFGMVIWLSSLTKLLLRYRRGDIKNWREFFIL